MHADRLDEARAILDTVPTERANGAPEVAPEDVADHDLEVAGSGRDSQASELVKFVLGHCRLVHDENSDVYAIDKNTHEVRPIERRAFKNWLLAAYYDYSKRVARTQSYSEAIQTLAGVGRHEGDLVTVYIRCATVNGGYVIDLGEAGNSRAIRVEPGSWRIADDPGVMFVRPESLKPLPEPAVDGDVSDVWKLLNIPEHLQLLVIARLIDGLRPDTPFPLLELIGEQGSAKCSRARAEAGARPVRSQDVGDRGDSLGADPGERPGG